MHVTGPLPRASELDHLIASGGATYTLQHTCCDRYRECQCNSTGNIAFIPQLEYSNYTVLYLRKYLVVYWWR